MNKKPNLAVRPRASKIDKVIGQRIRQLRMQANLSQMDLASELDVTFQQIQKYENGLNRISAGRLILAAGVLKTTPHDILGWGGDKQELPNNNYSRETYKLVQSFQMLAAPLRPPIRHLIDMLIKNA